MWILKLTITTYGNFQLQKDLFQSQIQIVIANPSIQIISDRAGCGLGSIILPVSLRVLISSLRK